MPDPLLLGKSWAAAALVAAVLVLILSRCYCKSCLGAGAVFVGWCAGLALLGQLPHMLPREDVDRLLVIVLPAALIVEIIAARLTLMGWLGRIMLACSVAPTLLYSSSYVTDLTGPGSREWSQGQTLAIYAGLALAVIIVWTLLVRLTQRSAPTSVLLSLSIALGGAAVTIMLSGYATGGQLAVPLCGAVIGVALAQLRSSTVTAQEGALSIGLIGLVGLLIIGRFSAGLTTLNATLLLVAPIAGWLAERVTLNTKRQIALRLFLTCVPVAVAVFLAQQKFTADSARPNSAPNEPSVNDYLNFGK